jgi:hypothetical protein
MTAEQIVFGVIDALNATAVPFMLVGHFPSGRITSRIGIHC